MLFQAAGSYGSPSIMTALFSFFNIFGVLGLIIIGASQKSVMRRIKNYYFFSLSGIVSLIVYFLNMYIFTLISLGAESYNQLIIQRTIWYIISDLILIISYGVIFILIGLKNKRNNGTVLVISGILYSLYRIINILFQILYYFYIIEGVTFEEFSVIQMINILSIIVSIVAPLMFVVYCIRSEDELMKIPAVLLFCTSVAYQFFFAFLYLSV